MDFGSVVPLRLNEVWRREASDFTPWISDHIGEIGNLLGYEFESVQQEAAVGDFSLDILGKDLGSNRLVAIENQYGKSDHDHLGKLLTYCSGYDAKIVIIISEEFRDEHKKALEWLNENTKNDVEFYGLSVTVFKIDDSKPAYRFNIVVEPNSWQKDGTVKPIIRSTDRAERYQQYYQTVLDELREKKFSNAKKAQPQNWYTFASGFSGFGVSLSFSRHGTARVELYIDSGDKEKNKEVFDDLLQSRTEVQTELSPNLLWERLDEKQASRIALEIPASIDDSDEELEKVRAWMVEWITKFKSKFAKYLKKYAKANI